RGGRGGGRDRRPVAAARGGPARRRGGGRRPAPGRGNPVGRPARAPAGAAGRALPGRPRSAPGRAAGGRAGRTDRAHQGGRAVLTLIADARNVTGAVTDLPEGFAVHSPVRTEARGLGQLAFEAYEAGA